MQIPGKSTPDQQVKLWTLPMECHGNLEIPIPPTRLSSQKAGGFASISCVAAGCCHVISQPGPDCWISCSLILLRKVCPEMANHHIIKKIRDLGWICHLKVEHLPEDQPLTRQPSYELHCFLLINRGLKQVGWLITAKAVHENLADHCRLKLVLPKAMTHLAQL